MKAKEERLKTLIHAAYRWGRDNGEGRSEKNFNDFLETSLCKEKFKQILQ